MLSGKSDYINGRIEYSYNKIVKEDIEYYVIPHNMSCMNPGCEISEKCPSCGRMKMEGDAHIPTGRRQLNG